jgi:tight adherence protein B
MSSNLILTVIAFAVLASAEAVYYFVRFVGEQERLRLRQRLRAIDDPGHLRLLREPRIARSPSLDRLMRGLPFTESLELLLTQTDLTWTVASMLASGAMLALGLSALMLVVAPTNVVLLVLAVPLGMSVPILLALNARTNRSTKLSEQLPEALDLVVRSLRAGHGLMAGFKMVATEMPVPVAVEFGRCFEEQNVGVDFRDAITNLTARVPQNLDLKIFAVSVVVQHETGGNLIEILDNIATTLRERFKFQGKLRSLTAEGRVSGIILGALPIFAGGASAILNPQYMMLLVIDPIGRAIFATAMVLWVVGLLSMRVLSQVDV